MNSITSQLISSLSEESSHVAPKTPKCSTPPSGTTANDEEHPEEPREHPNSAIQVS